MARGDTGKDPRGRVGFISTVRQARPGSFEAGARAIQRAARFFSSVDSAPKAFSVGRPRSVSDGFMISFAAVTAIALSLLTYAEGEIGRSLPRDIIFFTADFGSGVLPIRTFFLIFFSLYALYAYGSLLAKLRLGGALLAKLFAVCVVVDALALISWTTMHVVWPVHVQQLLAGLAALAVFPHTILNQARLPAPSGSPVKRKAKVFEYALLILAVTVGILAAVVLETLYGDRVDFLRAVALLGGLGPGVFLVQQVFTIQLAWFGFLRVWWSGRKRFAPPVAVLIPAHNEAHKIGATIAAVDAAAGRYDGDVRVYVVENCSVDATPDVAAQAISAARHMTGEVLYCETPGKAKALNYGLTRISEEFLVRVDADTLVHPKSIRRAMRHFGHANVGVVGGMPYPYHGSGLLGRLRMIEVLLRHGFYQVALGAINGILGVPGMFAAYRTKAVMEAGGIVEEMNGEDTDISLRITNLGYRAVSDPGVRFHTEVPDSLEHLREQRTRWFRSVYHIAAHNRETILDGNLMTGAVILPFTLMNAARRAMLTPLVIYALIVLVLFGEYYTHPELPAVIAVVVGMPFVMACFVSVMWLRFDLVPFIPLYLGFRLLRSYYTLGAALSLRFPGPADRVAIAPKPLQTPEPEPERWLAAAE